MCDEDYFTAVGSTTPMQKLCGDSYTDQHRMLHPMSKSNYVSQLGLNFLLYILVYLTFNEEQDDITLGFFLSDAGNKDWKLRITRIPCSSQDLGISFFQIVS